MPVIKTNTATTSVQRQVPGSETNPSQALGRLSADAPLRTGLDDAARLAVSARTAAHADLVAAATGGPPPVPIANAGAASAAAELIRSRMLQQPGTAMLAQQNVLPDQVLALLRD